MLALLRLFKYLNKYRIMIILSLIILTISVLSLLLSPILTSWTIDCGIGDDSGFVNFEKCGSETRNFNIVIIGGVLIFLSAIVSGLLEFVSGSFIIKGSQGMGFEIRNALYKKIMSFSFANLDKWRTGELMIRMNSDVNTVRMFIRMGFFMIVRSLLMITVSLFFMFSINSELATIMVIVIPSILLLLMFFAIIIRPMFMKVRKKLDELNNKIQENLAGAKVVRAFSQQNYEINTFKEKNKDFLNTYMKVGYLVSVIFPFLFFIANIVLLTTIWIGGNSIITGNGNLSIGGLISFSQYSMMATFPVLMLGMVLSFLSTAAASAERINKVFKEEALIKERENPIVKDKLSGRIEFKNVSFKYGDGENAICNANFIINEGEKVGILGTTGSGKSTIANLIPRLYDVTDGEILIDGINIKDLSLSCLRRRVAMVLQETVLFSGSIRENLIFGNPSASDDEIEKAIEIANAKKFIMEKENKLDEIIGERGTGLSGGQKQRIAIARAIISNPDILILDDVTSSVDLQTENEIFTNLYNALKDKTTLIISQKVNSIKNTDKIIVMDKGEVIGIGTHDELINKNEVYKEIYNTQNANS